MRLALLVDRDADTREMYAEFLRLSNYDIDEADDGRVALAKVLSRRPNVIVSETRLPGMNGVDLCRVVRSDTATPALPFIFVTGAATDTELRQAEAAGADAVLVKPCLPEHLWRAMEQLFMRSHELRDQACILHRAADQERQRSTHLIARARRNRRRALSRNHERRLTMQPAAPAPTLVCPSCDQPLKYMVSQIGGVSERNAEQWDYYECRQCTSAFEHRQRTGKTRRCSFTPPRVSAPTHI